MNPDPKAFQNLPSRWIKKLKEFEVQKPRRGGAMKQKGWPLSETLKRNTKSHMDVP
jgi:hypothetical protein